MKKIKPRGRKYDGHVDIMYSPFRKVIFTRVFFFFQCVDQCGMSVVKRLLRISLSRTRESIWASHRKININVCKISWSFIIGSFIRPF